MLRPAKRTLVLQLSNRCLSAFPPFCPSAMALQEFYHSLKEYSKPLQACRLTFVTADEADF